MKPFIFNVLVVINIVGAAIFLYDKEASKWGRWRVRNWVMKLLAYIAALGVYCVVLITKHKTTKFKRTLIRSKYIALIQLVFLSAYLFFF